MSADDIVDARLQTLEFQRLALVQYNAFLAARRAARRERGAYAQSQRVDRTLRVWHINQLRDIRRSVQPLYDDYENATAAVHNFVDGAAIAFTPSRVATQENLV